MDKKILISLGVIVLVLALTIGGTMAWFTDTATIEPNVFTAGTVEIEADEDFNDGFEVTNWNPGDCTEKIITVENTGTKGILVRAEITESWTFKYEVDGNGDFVLDANGDRVELVDPQPIYPDDPGWEDVVDWDLSADWFYVGDPAFDPKADGYYYYDGMLASDAAKIEFLTKVCLEGAEAGNKYQGATYTVGVTFEAIQASNNASFDLWGINSIYGAGGTSSADWESFESPPAP